MFLISAHHNPYLHVGQNTMQAVLSLTVPSSTAVTPLPLALGIALDRSASMDGPKIKAAREGALEVIQALDESVTFAVVAFNDAAQMICGPMVGSRKNKQHAVQAIQTLFPSVGTAMSTALDMLVDALGQDQARTKQIMFLTDGKNEGEPPSALERAVARCKASNISINAWGIGNDWDAQELHLMADQTNGTADIIRSPEQIGATFTTALERIRKIVVTDVRMNLWTPIGVMIKRVQQVYPNIVDLDLEQDPVNPRRRCVGLGSFAPGDKRDYLIDLQLPVYEPGQQFLVVRPSVHYRQSDGEKEEASDSVGWVLAQWTEDDMLAAHVDEYVTYYRAQAELSQSVHKGQEALARGDKQQALLLLAKALDLSEGSGNEEMIRLLHTLVRRDVNGSIYLVKGDALSGKMLAINTGKTTKLH